MTLFFLFFLFLFLQEWASQSHAATSSPILLPFPCRSSSLGATVGKAQGLSFSEWSQLHDKRYRSIEEARERERVYNENADLVERLNKDYKERLVGWEFPIKTMNASFPLRNVTFTLNHFADLSNKEFKQLILMPPQKPHLIPNQRQDPC